MESLLSFPVGLSHPLVGSRIGAVPSRRADTGRFQSPPHQTQRADFLHWAFLFASRPRLCGWLRLEGLSMVTPRATLGTH